MRISKKMGAIGLLAPLLAGHWCFGQTLFTYGNKPVSTQSFLNAFHKNPGEGNRKVLMEAYLPLYINYVLKVQDAYDKKLDTLPAHRNEMQGYKVQLAESYIAESAGIDRLVDEKIVRMQTDVLLGHIFIGYQNGDTVKAMTAAKQAVARLQKGESWETVAVAFSTDPDVRLHKGEAGWITAFTIPDAYEDMVYNLPKGGFTQPVKASPGIHIFSKLNTRKAVGTVKVAQILLARYAGVTDAEFKKRGLIADSLYMQLQKGTAFEAVVAQYSEDRTSKFNGGVLPAFGPSAYDAIFEKEAFGLKNPGDYSKPFETSFGWHILKLIAKNPPPGKFDSEARLEIRNRLLANGQLGLSRAQYVKTMRPKMKFRNGAYQRKQLQQFTDSLLTGGNTATSGLNDKTTLFYFGSQPVPMSDWMAYIRVQTVAGKFKAGNIIDDNFNAFVESKATDYLPAILDEIDPVFAGQFKEFKDANLLFEAMERNVWGPSQTDSVALKNYFEVNKKNYTWDDNVLAVIATASDSLVASEIRGSLNQNPGQWRKLAEDYGGLAFVDSGRYELKVLQAAGHKDFTTGLCSPVVSGNMDGSFSTLCVLAPGEAGALRSFEEARGLVVSGYQQKLEDNWLNGLKKKYPVKINEAEWRKLLSQQD
jgi:peptidyl-prolyl cis-trans isomerase SurA